VLLRGLKRLIGSAESGDRPPRLRSLDAVVTVTDDGGSSGRLRRELGVLPPGDVRNCIVALAEEEDLLARLFQYRFPDGGGLTGHSFGNLFLTALTGITGRANGLNYCASKAGVMVMTKCLAIELAPKVRVNCVVPGTVRTPEVDERFDLAANEPAMAAKVLAGRIGEPEEVAAAIRFLISDEGGYVNGQKLIVDGGSFLY